ncbi:MAG: 50S ribosomal protein L19 [Bacilli bacterium]
MNKNLAREIAATQIRTDLPDFRTGDTLQVSVRIIENGKERTQMFQGVCIARRGSGVSETFIVRKFSNGVGVERNFPVNSPIIASIKVVKHGKVRRNKIYYLRERSGKSARLVEKL